MGLFSRKPANCPSGSVHAWKDDEGRLYDTKKQADKSNRDRRLRVAKSKLEEFLRVGRVEYVRNAQGWNQSFEQIMSYDEKKHPAMMQRDMTVKEVSEMLVHEWPFIKEQVENIREALNA